MVRNGFPQYGLSDISEDFDSEVFCCVEANLRDLLPGKRTLSSRVEPTQALHEMRILSGAQRRRWQEYEKQTPKIDKN